MKVRSLRAKFALSFLPLVICIVFLGAYCIYVLSSIHNQFRQLQQDVTPNAIATLELKEILRLLEQGAQSKKINRQQLTDSLNKITQFINSHPNHDQVLLDPEQKSSHETLHHAIRTMSLSEYILNQAESGWQAADLQDVAQFIHQERLALDPILDKHLAIHLKELERTESFVSDQYRHAQYLVGLTILIILLLTIIMLFVMMRSVIGPIRLLQRGSREIGAGNLDYQLNINTGDEFEFLADEFSQMASQLANMHAELDRKVQQRTEALTQANADLHQEISVRKQAQDEQKQAEEQVHILTQELIKIQETERQQIALDLHDNVAQQLSSLKVAGDLIINDLNEEQHELQTSLGQWQGILDQCISTVRELSYNLRPPGLEQIGLESAIADYCRSFSRQTKVKVHCSTAGLDKLPINYGAAIHIYRLIQEALHNIKKHAAATCASVKLVVSHPKLIVRIEDDGKGFDPEEALKMAISQKRLGLLGMKERIRLLNGSMKMYSEKDHGTRIMIEIPWDTLNEHQEALTDS